MLAHTCPLSCRLPFPTTYWTPSCRCLVGTEKVTCAKRSPHFTPINLSFPHLTLFPASAMATPAQSSLESGTWESPLILLSLPISSLSPTPVYFHAELIPSLSTSCIFVICSRFPHHSLPLGLKVILKILPRLIISWVCPDQS